MDNEKENTVKHANSSSKIIIHQHRTTTHTVESITADVILANKNNRMQTQRDVDQLI